MRPKGRFWTSVGLASAFGLLLYGLPRLPQPISAPALMFVGAWLFLAILAVGSFLHWLMGIDLERRRPDHIPWAVRRAASREISQLSRRRDYHRDYM